MEMLIGSLPVRDTTFIPSVIHWRQRNVNRCRTKKAEVLRSTLASQDQRCSLSWHFPSAMTENVGDAYTGLIVKPETTSGYIDHLVKIFPQFQEILRLEFVRSSLPPLDDSCTQLASERSIYCRKAHSFSCEPLELHCIGFVCSESSRPDHSSEKGQIFLLQSSRSSRSSSCHYLRFCQNFCLRVANHAYYSPCIVGRHACQFSRLMDRGPRPRLCRSSLLETPKREKS
mmetsp:Transcript_14545/g.54966  ORF Transcript_14545/g.54966 Transcript_14545/m.54966 type:complete len:229 (-) Transcript_14545:227-913(-)